MSAPRPVPGVRCECRLYPAGSKVSIPAGVFDTRSPVRAVRWIRVGVRSLVSTLDEQAAEPIHEWLLFGETPAVRALSQGQSRTYGFEHKGSRVQFTARPVLYLVLASRAGLPACSQLPSPPPALAAVAGRGIELGRPAGVCRLSDGGEFRG